MKTLISLLFAAAVTVPLLGAEERKPLTERTKEVITTATEKTVDTLGNAAEKSKDTLGTAAEATKDTAVMIGEKTMNFSEKAIDTAKKPFTKDSEASENK